MDMEIRIPQNHLSQLVDISVEKMSPSFLHSLHPGRDHPPYHPKMMLKIIPFV